MLYCKYGRRAHMTPFFFYGYRRPIPGGPLAEFGFELDEIRRLIKLVEDRGLERLLVEEDGRVIEIVGPLKPAGLASTVVEPLRAGPVDVEEVRESGAVEAEEEWIVVSSPVVGVYYRSPSPDTAPFVEVGDRVEAGQTIGLIEAMKVFSEVVSDNSGVVTAIAAVSGQLVRQTDPLLYLRPE